MSMGWQLVLYLLAMVSPGMLAAAARLLWTRNKNDKKLRAPNVGVDRVRIAKANQAQPLRPPSALAGMADATPPMHMHRL